MVKLDNIGNVIVTDECIPSWPHMPAVHTSNGGYIPGYAGTSICDFYSYYEKGTNGIEYIPFPYGNIKYPTGKINGYWVFNRYKASDYIPEFKRMERKKKLQKICH